MKGFCWNISIWAAALAIYGAIAFALLVMDDGASAVVIGLLLLLAFVLQKQHDALLSRIGDIQKRLDTVTDALNQAQKAKD